MAGRLVMVNGPNMVGIESPNTGKNSPDWPQQGFNIMLPPVQRHGFRAMTSMSVQLPGNTPRPNRCGRCARRPRRRRRLLNSSSPPVIYRDLAIFAGASENFLPPPGEPADPHAIDLRTGKVVAGFRVWCPRPAIPMARTGKIPTPCWAAAPGAS